MSLAKELKRNEIDDLVDFFTSYFVNYNRKSQ